MNHETLKLSNGLLELIQVNTPFWSGEAEVIRSYWSSPIRSQKTDRKWLIHQIYKEYWDGILPPLGLFNQYLIQASKLEMRLKLLEITEILHEEVEHFCLFTNLYQVLEATDYQLTPDELKEIGSWPENDVLMNLRKQHKAESPELGQRATRFTEGGYCTLFTEGMKLSGRNDNFDIAIAEVCKKIYQDEFKHMLLGIIDIDENQFSKSDWEKLNEYTVAQMQKRIIMRNAQFSYPVAKNRLNELLGGKATGIKFDFKYADNLLRQ